VSKHRLSLLLHALIFGSALVLAAVKGYTDRQRSTKALESHQQGLDDLRRAQQGHDALDPIPALRPETVPGPQATPTLR